MAGMAHIVRTVLIAIIVSVKKVTIVLVVILMTVKIVIVIIVQLIENPGGGFHGGIGKNMETNIM